VRSYLDDATAAEEQKVGEDGSEGLPHEEPPEEEVEHHDVHHQRAHDNVGISKGRMLAQEGINGIGPSEGPIPNTVAFGVWHIPVVTAGEVPHHQVGHEEDTEADSVEHLVAVVHFLFTRCTHLPMYRVDDGDLI
jgi:hypothetical protein